MSGRCVLPTTHCCPSCGVELKSTIESISSVCRPVTPRFTLSERVPHGATSSLWRWRRSGRCGCLRSIVGVRRTNSNCSFSWRWSKVQRAGHSVAIRVDVRCVVRASVLSHPLVRFLLSGPRTTGRRLWNRGGHDRRWRWCSC